MSIAIDRLLKLPAVFSIHDLTKETFTQPLKIDTAKKFVLRMQEHGYIQAAGPRTSYYYNLIVDKDGPLNLQMQVAELVYPESIMIGLNVLHAYGWITQIPRTFDIAVHSDRRTLTSIYGIEPRRRPQSWFKLQQENNAILKKDESPFLIDSLTPRAALDDINHMQDIWVPGSDDLFIPENEEEDVIRLHPQMYRPKL